MEKGIHKTGGGGGGGSGNFLMEHMIKSTLGGGVVRLPNSEK